MTKKDKSLSERAIEAQVNQPNLADELGLTDDEVKTITAFSDLCRKRTQLAPVDPVLSTAEMLVQKRFPNNQEAQDKIDQTRIFDYALKYVEDSCFGYPSDNLRKPAPIAKAKEDLISVSHRLLASPDDPNLECTYADRVRWLTQMQVQQQFKDQLSPIFEALHRVHRGYKFNAPDRTQNAVEKDEYLAILMA